LQKKQGERQEQGYNHLDLRKKTKEKNHPPILGGQEWENEAMGCES